MKIALSLSLVNSQTAAAFSASVESDWLWGDDTEIQWGDASFIRIF